jgi:glutamate synthase domain-containing protein 2
LPDLIAHIRRVNPDVPVGVKLPASNHLEDDLEQLVKWGIDVITLDGGEAASSSSPAVISDHFGLATAPAIARAHHWLSMRNARHAVSLVASGGARGAADIAKLLALGADAVALGTSVLIAASSQQVARVLPFHGPSRLVFADPTLPSRQLLHVDRAVESTVRWLKATQSELILIAQALGVDHIQSLSARHLVARTARAQHVLDVAQVERAEIRRWLGQVSLLMDDYIVLRQTLERQWQGLSQLRSEHGVRHP